MPNLTIQFNADDTGYASRFDIGVDEQELDTLKYTFSKLNWHHDNEKIRGAKGGVFVRVWDNDTAEPVKLEGVYDGG